MLQKKQCQKELHTLHRQQNPCESDRICGIDALSRQQELEKWTKVERWQHKVHNSHNTSVCICALVVTTVTTSILQRLYPAVSAVTPPSLPHHQEDPLLRWMALVPEAPAAIVALWCSKCDIHKGKDVYLQLNYRSMFSVSASTHGDKSTLMSCSG